MRFSLRTLLIAFTLLSLVGATYPWINRTFIVPRTQLQWSKSEIEQLESLFESEKPVLIVFQICWGNKYERLQTRLETPEFRIFAHDHSIQLREVEITITTNATPKARKPKTVGILAKMLEEQYDIVGVPIGRFVLFSPGHHRIFLSRECCNSEDIVAAIESGFDNMPEDKFVIRDLKY